MTTKKKTKATKAQRVIVRTYSAGVHYGVLVSRDADTCVLRDAKRIWSWKGANTLHEISLRGVGAGSRVSERVKEILINKWIEILPCERAAVTNLETSTWTA